MAKETDVIDTTTAIVAEKADKTVGTVEKWWNSVDTDVAIAYAIDYGTAIIGAILIFVVGRILAGWFRRIFERTMLRHRMDPTIVGFVGNIFYGGMMVLIIVAAISTLGVETTSLAAAIAAAGLAIGLALQGSLSNFASGVLIITFRPFAKGDFITAAGISGSVQDISIINTTLKTGDGNKVTIPNSKVVDGPIINFTANDTRKMEVVISASYDDAPDKVLGLLKDIVASEPRVLAEPAPQIVLGEYGESSVNYYFRPWMKNSEYWDTYFELMKQIKLRFDAEGISMPFPQRDFRITNEQGEALFKGRV